VQFIELLVTLGYMALRACDRVASLAAEALTLTRTAGSAWSAALALRHLARAYARDAGQRGLLDPGDITEAVAMAPTAGDPLRLPQDTPGAHRINDDRITAFMRGYLGGSDACAVPEEGCSRGSDEEEADAAARAARPG
jgi:hypothetical protein